MVLEDKDLEVSWGRRGLSPVTTRDGGTHLSVYVGPGDPDSTIPHRVSVSSIEKPVGCRLVWSLVWTWVLGPRCSKYSGTRILGSGCRRGSWTWTLGHGNVDEQPVQSRLSFSSGDSIRTGNTSLTFILLGFSGVVVWDCWMLGK